MINPRVISQKILKDRTKAIYLLALLIFLLPIVVSIFTTQAITISAQTVCSDSDGGSEPFVYGYVTGIGPNGYPYTKYDVCETGSYEGYLKEMICVNENPQGRRMFCINGCSNGVCSTEPTPTPFPSSSPTPTPFPTPTPLPTPTPTQGPWAPCEDCHFGTQIIGDISGQFILNIKEHPGFVFSGNILNGVTYYPQLQGWTRGLGGGSLQQIQNKHSSAVLLGIGDQYECLVYAPESGHSAGTEALYPDINIITARSIADQAGKCLMYAPAIADYEDAIELVRGIPGEEIIPLVAPYVDIWGYQFGLRQGLVDTGSWTKEEFLAWFDHWADIIKSSNPNIKIIAQLGIGGHDPATDLCQPPPTVEYVLEWREMLAPRVDGLVIMASQPCQPCPPNPPLGFPCSTDPQDIEYYRQYFQVAEQAVNMACFQ